MKLTVLDRIWIRLSQQPNFLRIPFPRAFFTGLNPRNLILCINSNLAVKINFKVMRS